MNIQIFGKSKCFDTKKAERWFKERGIRFQSIDLLKYGMSGGEFDSVLRAIQSLKAAGVQNIRCKLYPGARHELLVETNRQEVFADIAAWLNDQLR